jgi:YD repeat-containing protein
LAAGAAAVGISAAGHERKATRIFTAVVLALLAGAAAAQPANTFFNERGQVTGSSSTSGNVTTFRDRSGRMTGTAERMRDGSVQYRDAMGRRTGSTTVPRR